MEDELYIYIGYIIAIVLIVEYIYHCTYLPNLKRGAQNGYQDW